MAEKPEDFNLPISVIAKLIKDCLPPNSVVSKDARQALSKAASFFILYLTSTANNFATENERNNLTEQDICDALNQMGFIDFVPHLQSCYDDHRKEKSRKQRLKAKQKARQDSIRSVNVVESNISHVDLNLDSPDSVDDCVIIDDFINENVQL